MPGRRDEGTKSFEVGQACGLFQKLTDDNPTVTGFVDGLGSAHNNIGAMLVESGRLAEGLKSHESARKIRQKLVDDNPTVAWYQSELAGTHLNIGNLRHATGKSAEARKSYEAALAIKQKLARDEPESPGFQSDLGGTLNNLASIEMEEKRFEPARDSLQQAIECQRKALAVHPANQNYRQAMGTHLVGLVKACRGLDDARGAAEAEQELAKFRASDPAVVALDARLAAILKGDQTPRDNSERLQLAQRAYENALHASAARLWAEALADATPSLAADYGGPASLQRCLRRRAGGRGSRQGRPWSR